jgi:cell division protease FtsH
VDKKSGFNIAYVVFAVLTLLLLRDVSTQVRSVETVPYSTFEQYLREGKIEDVAVSERLITGRLKSPDEKGKTSIVAPLVEPAMAERLSHFGVTYTRTFEPTWLRELLSWVVPVLIFFGIWFVLARKFASGLGAGGLIGIGKSKAKVYMEKQTGVTFDDVAGVDEAKAEL